jgi:serpin B
MMRCSRTLIVFLTLTSIFLTPLVCSGQEAEAPNAETMRELALGNSAFALDLYQVLSEEPGNLFISPYSVSSALAITYGGARGNTATQMADALHFTLDGKVLHQAFGSLDTGLRERGASGEVDFSLASALWGQKGEEFLDSFTALGKKHYGTEIRTVDFAGDAGGALEEINAWASNETAGRITNIIEPGMLDASTAMVISNAIYFKAGWASKFDSKKTWEEPFWAAPDSSVMADMMHQTRRFRYAETGELKILELPYAGEDLSMIILLPRERAGLAGVERFLTLKSLRIWLRQLGEEDLIVSLPRFKAESNLLLNDALKRLGMTDAFGAGSADFSGMTGGKDLFVGAVVQKALIEVAEEGTEAAAGTAVVMKKGPAPKQFRADHPFIFMIRDKASGSILFLGRMLDPTA